MTCSCIWENDVDPYCVRHGKWGITAACATCKGKGSIEKPHPSGWEEWGTIYGECPTCEGTGSA